MYTLSYDKTTGKVVSIIKANSAIPICEDNTDFQDFLKWNAEQETPLDLDSTIEPVVPEKARDLAKEIDDLKARVKVVETVAIK